MRLTYDGANTLTCRAVRIARLCTSNKISWLQDFEPEQLLLDLFRTWDNLSSLGSWVAENNQIEGFCILAWYEAYETVETVWVCEIKFWSFSMSLTNLNGNSQPSGLSLWSAFSLPCHGVDWHTKPRKSQSRLENLEKTQRMPQSFQISRVKAKKHKQIEILLINLDLKVRLSCTN